MRHSSHARCGRCCCCCCDRRSTRLACTHLRPTAAAAPSTLPPAGTTPAKPALPCLHQRFLAPCQLPGCVRQALHLLPECRKLLIAVCRVHSILCDAQVHWRLAAGRVPKTCHASALANSTPSARLGCLAGVLHLRRYHRPSPGPTCISFSSCTRRSHTSTSRSASTTWQTRGGQLGSSCKVAGRHASACMHDSSMLRVGGCTLHQRRCPACLPPTTSTIQGHATAALTAASTSPRSARRSSMELLRAAQRPSSTCTKRLQAAGMPGRGGLMA